MTLEVRHLSKRFVGVQAVADVSFEVRPGECVALIGPNGAGKSTTFACIAGQQEPDGGTVGWDGVALQDLSAAQRPSHGIVRTFQVAQVFESLTVLQNLQLAQQARQGLSASRLLCASDAEAPRQLLGILELEAQAPTLARKLPYGAKKRLELAIAPAGIPKSEGQFPHLLLLDEPAAGLAAEERAELMALVKSLSRHGHSNSEPGMETSGDPIEHPLAVLYTEHNMDAVFGVADRVIVLMDGSIVAQGSPQEVSVHPVVRQRYLGQHFRYHEAAHA